MIKQKIFFTVLFFFFVKILFSQSTEKAFEIIQNQTIYINSAFSISGSSRKVIPVQLPPNTIRWYYSFSAFRNALDIQNSVDKFNLFSKLSLLIDKSGTTAAALSVIGNPPGTNYCDVYLLSSVNEVSPFENKSDYTGGSFSYNRQGSRQNFVSGVIDVTDKSNISGWQYLGIKNPDLNDGVNVILQVVAIVYNEPSTNGWTPSVKQQVYDKLKNAMAQTFSGQIKQNEIETLCGCIMTNLTNNYTPQQITTMAEYEQKSILNKLGESCSSQLIVNVTDKVTSRKDFDEKKIIAKWGSNDFTLSLMEYGILTIQWNSGKFKFGSWRIKDNKLQITYSSWDSYLEYEILELTDSNFKYKSTIGEKTTYETLKVYK